MGDKVVFRFLSLSYKRSVHPRVLRSSLLIYILAWLIWCFYMTHKRYAYLTYPFLKKGGIPTPETKTFLLSLIIPVIGLTLCYVIILLMNTSARFWIALVVCTLLLIAGLQMHSAFVSAIKVVSQTDNADYYMIPDQDVVIPENVFLVFPKYASKQDSYIYYRQDSIFADATERYIALCRVCEADTFQTECDRLRQNDLLTQTDSLWDGYKTYKWSGYTFFATNRPIDPVGNGYIWVLINNTKHTIIYYYRMRNLIQDSFFESFLNSTAGATISVEAK